MKEKVILRLRLYTKAKEDIRKNNIKKYYIVSLIIIGIIFLVLSVYYWVTPAGSLPSGFPGYEAGSSHHHFKHGLAAALLGVGCFVWAWFASGSKPLTESQNKD